MFRQISALNVLLLLFFISIYLDILEAKRSKGKYKRHTYFRSSFDNNYVKRNISIGMKVRCVSDLLKLDEGDIGTVIAIDDDEDLRGPNLEVSRKLNCNCILLWHRPFIISILPFIYIYRCTGKEKILNCGFALITLKCYQMVKLWISIRVSQLKVRIHGTWCRDGEGGFLTRGYQMVSYLGITILRRFLVLDLHFFFVFPLKRSLSS